MNRVLLAGLQAAMMIAVAITTTGAEHWLAGFGKTEAEARAEGAADACVIEHDV